MNNYKSQADTLGLLLWIYAGIQAFFALLILFIVLLYGVGGVIMIATARNASDAAPAAAFMAVYVAIFVVLLAFGIASIVLNVKAGRQLKSASIASKNLVIASAIGNFLSFMCGGMCLAPFGIGLGIFGLWFVLSDTGKAYFSGLGINTPPPVQNYHFNG